MHRLIAAGAVAISLAATPAALQAQVNTDSPPGSTNSVADKRPAFEMNQQQQADHDSWPQERQVMYFGWDAPLQEYYWTLSPEERAAWWYLTDAQRAQVWQLSPEQRDVTWVSIISQVKSQRSTQVAPGTAANRGVQVKYVSDALVQQVPERITSGDYPVCSQGRTDACVNPWEAGKRGSGVTRPLDHWPGPQSDS